VTLGSRGDAVFDPFVGGSKGVVAAGNTGHLAPAGDRVGGIRLGRRENGHDGGTVLSESKSMAKDDSHGIPIICMKPSSHQPTKAELREPVSLGATPEEVIRRAFLGVRVVQDENVRSWASMSIMQTIPD